MLRRLLSRAAKEEPEAAAEPFEGQLDNQDLEALVLAIAGSWEDSRARVVVEVGTGGGRGSTVAINRALTATNREFRLIGYEGDTELATQAAQYWRDGSSVRVVNEYFMHREDIDLVVKPLVAASDRAAYLPEFAAVSRAENFLTTTPPGPVDILFIDSVRYTHLAILLAALSWLTPETVVLMEDDIPEYGELAIVERKLRLRDVAKHQIAGHLWPLVEFKLVL